MTDVLLAHVVSQFAPRQWENIATDSLRFLMSGPAGVAPGRILAPLLPVPLGLLWRSQVTAIDDPSIPDLVGEDATGRPVVIIEGRFWAALTENQPNTYLERQRLAFGDEPVPARFHALIFLVPARRQALVAHEFSARMGCSSEPSEGLGLTVLDNGQLVVVVSWGRILAEVQGCLDEVSDESGLANLAQLWGLCDRADAEAMLPIHPSEIGSEVAHRLCDLLDIVDGVTDELVRRKKVSLRGLRSVGGKGYYGRGIKSEDSGHTLQLCLLSYSWAYRYPTPIWLRIWKPSRSAVNAWASLEGTDGIPFSDSDQSDGWIRLGLSVPMGVESDQVVARLAENVERAMAALPRDASAEEAHAMPDSMDSDLPSDLDPQG